MADSEFKLTRFGIQGVIEELSYIQKVHHTASLRKERRLVKETDANHVVSEIASRTLVMMQKLSTQFDKDYSEISLYIGKLEEQLHRYEVQEGKADEGD